MKWFRYFARAISPQYFELVGNVYGHGHLLRPFSIILIYYKDGFMEFWIDQNEFEKVQKEIDNKHYSYGKIEDFIKLLKKKGKNYIKTAKECSLKSKNANRKELIKLYRQYHKRWVDYTKYLSAGFEITGKLSQDIENLIKGRDSNSSSRVIDYVFAQKKKVGIHLLMYKIKKGINLEKIYEDFEWIPCFDINDNPWGKEEFKKIVEELRKTPIKKKKKDKTNLDKFNEKEKKFLRMGSLIAYFKDLRDDYRRKGQFYAFPLYDNIAKELGLTRKEIAFFFYDEMISSLEGKELPLIGKKKELLIEVKGKKSDIFYGKRARKRLNKLGVVVKTESELKGTIASTGRAQGTVKIIKKKNEFSKIKKGDFLVAVITHPDYIGVIEKSAAMIIEEGGITSHAAIVSREMKKPCIVGVKEVTKILKDGDLVEVDANKGIVKIIKQSNK